MKKASLLLLLILISGFVGNLVAQKMPYQGRLIQNNIPVNDTVDITFSIDTLGWSEGHINVLVVDGLYSLVLGSINPLPDNLFEMAEHNLNISVDGTPLSPVKIYPALTKTSEMRKLLVNSPTTKGDTALYTEIIGGSDTLMYSGILSTAKSTGVNVGVRGNAYSTAAYANYQVGTWGRAQGDANAYHYGVIGQAVGKGPRNMGIYGVASGEGNGQVSLDSGSYNQGVFGVGLNNPWGNVGVYGEASGPVGEDNIGVVGWSFVGDQNTTNNGLLGWAKGTGVNRGVVGLATGGTENWAGWFEGNIAIVDTAYIQRINIQRNGRIRGYGSNYRQNWSLSGVGAGSNYGSFALSDSSGTSKVWGQAYPLADGRAMGLFTLVGPSQGAIQGGFRSWESDSLVNLPWLTLEGNIPNKSLVYLEGVPNGSGVEYGSGRFETTEDGRHTVVSSHGLSINSPSGHPTIEITRKSWQNINYGVIRLRDTTFNSMVEIEVVDDAYGAIGQTIYRSSYDTRNAVIGPNEILFHGPNDPAVQIGSKHWDNPNLGIIAVKGPGFTTIASMEAFTDSLYQWGQANFTTTEDGRLTEINPKHFLLRGPGTMNVEIGSVEWDIANAGLDRGYVNIYNSSNVPMIHMRSEHNGTTESGFIEVIGGGGYIHLESLKDTIAVVTVSDGTNNLELRGNGEIYANGFYLQSDERYKNNIEALTGALKNTTKLNGVSYYWNEKSKGTDRQIGLIAQEVEEVYPELVHTNSDGYKSVNYAQMVAVLIEAIKELNQEISTLKAENSSLKAQLDKKMNDINSRLELLEKVMTGLNEGASASTNK